MILDFMERERMQPRHQDNRRPTCFAPRITKVSRSVRHSCPTDRVQAGCMVGATRTPARPIGYEPPPALQLKRHGEDVPAPQDLLANKYRYKPRRWTSTARQRRYVERSASLPRCATAGSVFDFRLIKNQLFNGAGRPAAQVGPAQGRQRARGSGSMEPPGPPVGARSAGKAPNPRREGPAV
jgi:hypothetical protein